MSRLNRKEFKELLNEWNKSLINERDFKSLNIGWGTSISSQQEEKIKSVNFDAEMLNFPVPNKLLSVNPSKKLHKIFQNRFSIFKKNEKNYSLIKNAIKNFYKSVVLNPRSYKKSLQKDYEEIISNEPAYNEKSIVFSHKEEVDKVRVLEDIENLFEEKKDILTGKSKKDNIPFFVYFTKTFSDVDEMASGGLFKISELSEDVSNSFLKWLFHHDFYHVLELYGQNRVGNQIKDVARANVNSDDRNHYYYIKIKGLEESLNSHDNFASVMPYILSKSQEEARNFLEENYVSYDEYSKFASINDSQVTSNSFNQEKEQNISKILEDLVVFKDNFQTILDNLRDYIVIASYEISGSKTVEVEDLPPVDDTRSSKYALINFRNLSEDNLDRIINYAIDTQNGNLLYSIALSNWSVGICSKKSQIKLINMDISNKASFDIDNFSSNYAANGKNYIVHSIIRNTKHQDVVELACEKYYNSFEIASGEFVKILREIVEEHWPQVDTSKFLDESLLKSYIDLIFS